jgi:DNA-binding protein HU-beta
MVNKNMKKNEFIKRVAEKTGLTSEKSNVVFLAIIEELTELMVKRDELTIVGFGNFSTGTRKAQKGRNPQTGELIKIPKSCFAKFKMSKVLKTKMNA